MTPAELAGEAGIVLDDQEHGLMDHAARSTASSGGGPNYKPPSTAAWSASRGPVDATQLSLARIGWKWPKALVFIDDLGDGLPHDCHSPAMWAQRVRAAGHDPSLVLSLLPVR